ncbi:MAG: tetratricopeptide repeat protein [Cyclobacteriaceae bacterium]|nr:tetratricopeptide repeat protein [Cyclobacteriaceae bacterium]MDH4297342.1 tetratricopeptide repeat protein [Cyclobacteriaceae bacterium]MDH5248094.1 tetratricopeptide repeat protein [Cyclobacteriaceae bacterium]
MDSLKITAVFCILFCSWNVYAQTGEIDSLKEVVRLEKNDSLKVDALIELGTAYLNVDLDEGLRYGNQARDLAEKSGVKKGLGFALKLLGLGYVYQGNYVEADIQFKASLAVFESIDFKDGISNILNNLGSLNFVMGDDAKSIEYHLKSLKVAEEINNKYRIATNLNNIGSVYANKEASYDKAIDYFLKALPIFKEIDYTEGIGTATVNIGEMYFKTGLYDSALTFFETSIKMYEGTADAALALSYVGEIYAWKNDFQNALNYHNQAVQITEKLGAQQLLAQSLLSLAKTLKKKGDLLKSIETSKRAQQISEEIKARQEIKNAYESLADSYANIGNFKNAYHYETLLSKIKDTLYNSNEDKKIQQLQFNFNIDKKEAEINLLTKDQALKAATIQRQKIVNYAAAITGLLLLFVIYGFYNRYKYIRKTNKIIEQERDRSKELLLNILPEETAYELETKGHAQTRYYENVTVLFTDFKGFSTIAGKLTPQALVAELNDYFIAFDEITNKYGLEKIKTIGDAYMCAGGIPTVNDTNPLDAVKAGLAMQEFMKKRIAERNAQGLEGWELRIGIHTGPVVAGVVGKMKYAYDIWGDTVNIASRMESNGAPGKVNISSATYNQIKENYQCLYRGKISAKNIGEVDMYFVESSIRKPSLQLA